MIPLPNLRACALNDGKHGRWQAALLEAFYGNVLIVFSRAGNDQVMQAPLDAANFREAEQLLADTDTPSLLTLPAKATPWQ